MIQLGNKLYTWLLGALAALATIAGIYLRGRSAGKKTEQAKQAKQELAEERARGKTIQEASDAQIEVGRLPAADVHQRLRDKFTRD